MHLDFSKCMPHRQETHTAANRKQKSQHVSISHLNSSPSECRWFGGVSVVASETHKNEHRLLQKCTELFAAWQRSECEGFPSCDACIFPDFYASQRVFVCPPAWQLPLLIGRTWQSIANWVDRPLAVIGTMKCQQWQRKGSERVYLKGTGFGAVTNWLRNVSKLQFKLLTALMENQFRKVNAIHIL